MSKSEITFTFLTFGSGTTFTLLVYRYRSDTTFTSYHMCLGRTQHSLYNTCLGQTQRLPCATRVSVKHRIHLVPHVCNPNTTFTFYNTCLGQKQHSFCTHVSMPDTTAFTFYYTCLSQIQHSLCTEPRVYVREHSHCTVFLSSS